MTDFRAPARASLVLNTYGEVTIRQRGDGDWNPARVNELGGAIRHSTSAYLNNRLEQDHRGIKGRYRPIRGVNLVPMAGRFCRTYDQLRSFNASVNFLFWDSI